MRYDAEYESRSQRSSRMRARRRQRDRARRAGSAVTPERAEFRGWERERQRSLREMIKERWENGFEWHGGPFAGSQLYRRQAFIYKGLVSDHDPILKLFSSKVRRAKHLRTGRDKATLEENASKLLALDAPYIEANKRCCGVLRVDVDTVLTADEIAAACDSAKVPPPNLVVGWTDVSGRLVRPHLLWLLHNSVPLEGKGYSRFRGLYQGVLRGLTHALLSVGAHPAALLNAHRHKNPLCPLWDRQILAKRPFDLSAIALTVDVTIKTDALTRKAAEMRVVAPLAPDHPDPQVAAGSNKLFNCPIGLARSSGHIAPAAKANESLRTGLPPRPSELPGSLQ
jgi:hypothetical protein